MVSTMQLRDETSVSVQLSNCKNNSAFRRFRDGLIVTTFEAEWAYEKMRDVMTNGIKLEPKEKLKVLQPVFMC